MLYVGLKRIYDLLFARLLAENHFRMNIAENVNQVVCEENIIEN